MNKLKLKQIQFFVKDNWIVLITFFVFFIMILLVYYSFGTLSIARIEESSLLNETRLLKSRVDAIQVNSQLKTEKIRIYNELLKTLIPESEDFFSIIYALEKISVETDFIISNYTVKVASSTNEKISLVVAGKGDVNTFMEFLKNYNYIGSRLATSETIQFSGTNVDTQVNLNFYNKKYVSGKDVIPQLTPKDIQQLNDILSKVKINFGETPQVLDADYEITDNPFN